MQLRESHSEKITPGLCTKIWNIIPGGHHCKTGKTPDPILTSIREIVLCRMYWDCSGDMVKARSDIRSKRIYIGSSIITYIKCFHNHQQQTPNLVFFQLSSIPNRRVSSGYRFGQECHMKPGFISWTGRKHRILISNKTTTSITAMLKHNDIYKEWLEDPAYATALSI